MRTKDTLFYRINTSISVDFSAPEVSSHGSLILLETIERKNKLIQKFSKYLPDLRNPNCITYTREDQFKQRIYMIMLGYKDVNDVTHLQHDPLFKDVLQGNLASQPTISRFENSLDKQSIFELCNAWVDHYVSTLSDRKHLVIDVDATDDPTHGNQQMSMSMFNGYYGQFMLNELFFHDGETGQIILPVLRPGNSHSNKWYIGILRRIIIKIRAAYPNMEIVIRTDSGFSCAPFYELVDKYNLLFVTGQASNSVLKKKTSRAQKAVKHLYLNQGEKHQHFIKFPYQAKSWHKEQQCYSKIESTGLGMNVRHFISNLKKQDAREIYFGFYVLRGEASENRIKEVKNMCFSDRLSNHGYWGNFFRLFISSLAYEMFLLIKQSIKKTSDKTAKKWQVSSIRTNLLKVGAMLKITKKRIVYQLSKAFVYKDLFRELITQ